MTDFLSENNICGQIILQLVSRGNAIIAELLRLKKYIPSVFRLETKQDILKYGNIIFDFSYFKTAEIHEQIIERNEAVRKLDREFCDNNVIILKRFYLVFESIHIYIIDLNQFIEELEDRIYIHQSLETIFMDIEGRQLMCEALYLYGLMLLIADLYIDGVIRERLLVAYYRYSPQRQDTQSCIDEVCKLLRDTGYHGPKRPTTYPDDYFRRIPIKSNYINYVIGHLRSNDIYEQMPVYPLPKHRSTALTNQSAMLFICLYFSSNILHSQTAIMREIVDKYFPDNWVISLYMGHTANLVEWWEPFRAAKSALQNTVETTNVRNYACAYGRSVQELLETTAVLLKEGNITIDSILKDIDNIISTLIECNVTIRWLMLHTMLKSGQNDRSKKLKQLREVVIVESKYLPITFFKLLLNTAQLELIVKDLFRQMLPNKEKDWKELKNECYKCLVELSEIFSGKKDFSRIKKNENLQHWFVAISKQVQSLDINNSSSSRKTVQLIQALEEVQEYHQLDSNMQVLQILYETRRSLDQMVRRIGIKEDILIKLQIIGDISYAWELIDSYTDVMQFGIKKDPTLVIRLRTVFLKLASALEIPLLRINEAHSEDLMSVSQYYSKELEIYVRKVLQIIPNMMFEKLARIIEMQTSMMKELPTRIDKHEIKSYAQLEKRFEFAELTNSISVFSQGMRIMKNTLVGVVCLDPKKLLEDGIRKELVQHISNTVHNQLIFASKTKPDHLELRLKKLVEIMDGYKQSFEYIQDYINLNGLKIWQEEVTRIINYYVEQECNGFLQRKVHPWHSDYQNTFIPIPSYEPIDSSANFIGRLSREIIRITDPKCSIYLDNTLTWYDIRAHQPLVNKECMVLITSAIEIAGLVGLDRLLIFMIISALQKLLGYLEFRDSQEIAWSNIITSIQREIKQTQETENHYKVYGTYVNRCTKIWPDFLENVLFVGQLQLLRKLITFHLNMSCKFNAKALESSLGSLNRAILMDLKKTRFKPSEDILCTLSDYLNYTGLNEPLNKKYISPVNNLDHSITMFLFTMAHLSKLFLPYNTGHFSRRGQDQIDGIVFSAGVHTLLRQFHSDLNKEFIQFQSNYILHLTRQCNSIKWTDLPAKVIHSIQFMETYTNFSEESKSYYTQCLPKEILEIEQNICFNPII